MSDKHATLENRDGFQSKWGFILACIGSAVGMGNIWRFPIMVQQFGGMTFLIPYFLFVLLIGSTGIIEEFALGRWAQGGPVISFGKATEERTGNKRLGEAIGALPIVGSMMLAIGYTVVMSWIFKYCWMGISGSLYALGTDMGNIGGTFGATAPEADTLGEALGMMFGNGIFGIGNGVWLIVGLVVSLAIMAMGVGDGIEKANKIMMPLLFGLFVILVVEKLWLKKYLDRWPVLGHLYMLVLIPLSWAVFSVSDLGQLGAYFGRLLPLFSHTAAAYPLDFLKYGKTYGVFLVLGLLCSTSLPAYLYRRLKGTWAGAVILAVLFWLCLYCLSKGMNDPFMYFRF